MDVSLQLIFQNYGDWLDEGAHVAAEQRLAEMAEPLGFAAVFVVEHHFFDYSGCPDNAQFLAWLAARTSRIKLATGAFILPWNTPVRVAEKIVLLDHLSGGRAVLGLGRGLAKREYAAFGIAMNESRDRFDEAAAMILEACDTGVIAGDGPYYPQARTEIRPRPLRGFRDRLFAIGMSQESVEQAARLGARLAIFSQMPWPMWKETNYAAYQQAWRAAHGSEPPPPLTTDIMYCGESDAEAEEMARRHMVEYYLSVLQHYEIMGDHFKGVRGYEMYAMASEILQQIGQQDQADAYLMAQSYGSPRRILEQLRERWETIGRFDLSVIARYGTLPPAKAEASLRRFAEQVLPELRTW